MTKMATKRKNKLRHATGQKFWWNLELYQTEAESETPVLAKSGILKPFCN